MDNTKEKNSNIDKKNILEKKIIIYLLILFLILIYLALFLIHNIISIGTVSNSPFAIDTTQGDGTGNNGTKDGDGNGTGQDGTKDGDGSGAGQDGTKDGNGSGNNKGGNDNKENIVDLEDRLKIFEGKKEWKELKELSIFKNNYFKGQAIIAPGVEGTYNFTVENLGEVDFNYTLNFSETNPHKINMKYKIKYNGNYVAGNESTWVDYSSLNQVSRRINSKKVDFYTIEWKWEDADNDTEIGKTPDANYKLNVNGIAEAIINN